MSFEKGDNVILYLYVHDFHQEIGHTRATIDLLNHLTVEQKSSIKEIRIFAFTATDPSLLLNFPEAKIIFEKVPFPNLYPSIVKSLFFQIWTGVKYLLDSEAGKLHFSVGIAFLFPDVVNIQFIHHQWDELNQLYNKSKWYKRLYKWLLFRYFNFLEDKIYSRKNNKFLVLSKFSKDYLQTKFNLKDDQVVLTYSNVNTESFYVIEKNKNEICLELQEEGDFLLGIDFSKPVFLFVGAFERKGLDIAINYLEKINVNQLIVIGKSESGQINILNSEKVKIYYKSFTKKLNSYYNLADYFIFPTRYEPFGLVILEAAITGLHILVPRNYVGASELLTKDLATTFLDENNFNLSEARILTLDEKLKNSKERKKMLQQYSWEHSSTLFYQEILTKYKND